MQRRTASSATRQQNQRKAYYHVSASYMLWFKTDLENLVYTSFANKQDSEDARDEIKTCDILDLENVLGENKTHCRVVSHY